VKQYVLNFYLILVLPFKTDVIQQYHFYILGHIVYYPAPLILTSCSYFKWYLLPQVSSLLNVYIFLLTFYLRKLDLA